MMTERIPFASPADRRVSMPRIIAHLEGGGLIAYPTETVYGFGCALRDDALADLAALKLRTDDKPFLIVVLDAESLEGVVWTPEARALAHAFWPGPLTLALRAGIGTFPARVLGPAGTVAVRASSHEGVRELLAAFGRPLTSTSANPPGRPAARSAAEAEEAIAALGRAGTMLVLDGGPLPASAPSTIVDGSVRPPRRLRAGAVALSELQEIVHDIEA